MKNSYSGVREIIDQAIVKTLASLSNPNQDEWIMHLGMYQLVIQQINPITTFDLESHHNMKLSFNDHTPPYF